MRFPSVPTLSKSQIKKAGKVLADKKATPEEKEKAIEIAGQWRACHAYPINTFQSTLRRILRQDLYKNSFVAQRLKRMPTIIDKLIRYPTMQLTTMQDICGVRAVVKSIQDVYRLRDKYLKMKKTHFPHQSYNIKDYIQDPRNEDGYRSLHLIYKYKNNQNGAKQYNGLFVEMQIRTKLQHVWATAVETMGTFLGQALKSRQGDQEWLNFFAITSSVFAHIEKTTLIPKYKELDFSKSCEKLFDMEKNLGVLQKIKGFATAVTLISAGKKKTYHYHLLVLDSINKKVNVYSFSRDELNFATRAYRDFEKQAVNGKKIEPVLVSAGPITQLKQAYPNFFLDIQDFIKIIGELLSK